MAKLLIGCEKSQTVCIEFRKLGHEAYSCDTQDCSGGHPEWHITSDIMEVLEGGHITLQNGERIFIEKWDGLIAFPPCTFMSKAGARWMYPTAGTLCPERLKKGIEAKDFFMKLYNSKIKFISLENPQPMKVIGLPKYTQAVQPYEHGHPYSKKTFLWLKNLPSLLPTYFVNNYKPYLPSNTGGKKRGQSFMFKNISQEDSSKTFPGIAKAMAEQWNSILTTPGESQ